MKQKRTLFVALAAIMLLAGLALLHTADKSAKQPPVVRSFTRAADTITELQAQVNSLALQQQRQQQERPDYTKIWGAFTAFLVALFSGIKVLNDMSNKPLELRLEAIANDSKMQFTQVFQTLVVLEDSMVRKSVTDGLRAVVRGYMHYNRSIDDHAKMLIDCQCERVIEFSEEVMAETYKPENWEQTEMKLEIQSRKGRTQVKELFGDEYLEHYKVLQANAVNDFKERLRAIVHDEVVNSKYARYKNAAESFLHDLINETLALTHKWKTHEKHAHRHAG